MKDKGRAKPESERHLFDRILKYTGVFGSVQGLSILVNMVLTKVKSVWLGPEGSGITESLNRTTDLVRNSTNLGISMVAVPEISNFAGSSDQDGLADRIMLTRSWALLTSVIGVAVCLLLAPLLSRYAFDGDRGYSFSFMILSAAVAASAVTGGETAILRGTGMLRQIALSQLLAGVLSLCISVPLFWFLRYDGIVPALALTALATMVVTCFYSIRAFPYRARPFDLKYLKKGLGMIGFGLFFTITAFLGAWAWSFIARYLTVEGGPGLTGTYSTGYMLVTHLTTLLLSVTDSEYYPRLSAAGNDLPGAHSLMNSQSLAMCMLAAPLVILFMICVPVLVFVVLEYEKFYASIALAQMAVIGLFFKATYQPIAYLVLARSDSKIYLLQEVLCYILLVICVITGYNLAGSMGIGISLAAWELLYFLIVLIIGWLRYGFVMSAQLVRNFFVQGVIIGLAAVCIVWDFKWSFALSVVLCVASAAVSLSFFSSHTSFLPSLFSRFTRRS